MAPSVLLALVVSVNAQIKGTLDLGSSGTASIFGIEAEGSKIVYVFDRSGSMEVPDGKPLAVAKAELAKSVQKLGESQQFNIIVYNQAPRLLPIGQPGRLVFGSDESKEVAAEAIDGIEAAGATNHVDALVMALRTRADVIFLLTDGDQDDDLTPDDMTRIVKLNTAAAVINVVQFSPPPKQGANRLIALAKETGGQHVYVDLIEGEGSK